VIKDKIKVKLTPAKESMLRDRAHSYILQRDVVTKERAWLLASIDVLESLGFEIVEKAPDDVGQ
jgi:hypothetical protein